MDPNGEQSMDSTEWAYPTVEFEIPRAQADTGHHHDITGNEFQNITISLDPPMSFRERHRFLDGVYNSYPDPEHISAKDLVYIARQAGLCMEEAHAWFEDEFLRRSNFLAKLQGQMTYEPRPCSPESMTSYAPSQMAMSATNGSSESLQIGPNHYPESQSIFSGPSSPGTVSGDYLQIPPRVRRGRPPRTESSSPPQSKRQKIDCQYPCVDCGKAFPASRWSEHVKRVHFPDYIWECPKTLCAYKHFYRMDNFITHLVREHRCVGSEVSQLKATCKFAVIGFFHKVCGICGIGLKSRDESIDHTKEHLREISNREEPPPDLGLSEWTEKCVSKHTLQRGVHYRLDKTLFQQEIDASDKNEDGDPDNNKDDDQNRHRPNESHYDSFQDGGDGADGSDTFFGNTEFNYSEDSDFYREYRARTGPEKPVEFQEDITIFHTSNESPFQSLAAPLYPEHAYRSSYPYPTRRRFEPGKYRGESIDSDTTREKGRCTHPDCGKVFKDLKAHMLTHQCERPEKCPIGTCDYHVKGFARKYDKNRHTLTHYKGTMVCGFCPGSGSAAEKSFNRADVFKRHLTSVHGVEQTPPNSRRKSTMAHASSTGRKLSEYCPDATGKCSTCSETFNNAQDFYEHLDDCVLRIVQQEEPSEAIDAARFAEVEGDEVVHETLRNNALPITTTDAHSINEDDKEEDFDEDDIDDEDDDDFTLRSRSRKRPKTSANTTNGVQKSRGLTHSKGGVTLNTKGRKKRKDYPSSWGSQASQMKLKKRIPVIFDGPRRLWTDDMMLDTEHEIGMKLRDEKDYVTDLDVQMLRRADGLYLASAEEKGPWITDDLTGMDLEKLMTVTQES